MRKTSFFSLVAILLVCAIGLTGCAHGKDPVVLDHPPKEPYEVIQKIETVKEWHGLHWMWHWWHYMPWYPTVRRIHDKALIKKARKLGADAIINIDYLEHRRGARAEAIRYKTGSEK